MSKEKPQVIGRIIATRIREIDTSLVTRTENLTVEQKKENVKSMLEFEDITSGKGKEMYESMIKAIDDEELKKGM